MLVGLAASSEDGRDLYDAIWLKSAIARLKPALRDTAVLVAGQQLTHAEAAAILGIAEATVAWRMHEVRRILRGAVREAEKYFARPQRKSPDARLRNQAGNFARCFEGGFHGEHITVPWVWRSERCCSRPARDRGIETTEVARSRSQQAAAERSRRRCRSSSPARA